MSRVDTGLIEVKRIRDFLEANGFQWLGDYHNADNSTYHNYTNQKYYIEIYQDNIVIYKTIKDELIAIKTFPLVKDSIYMLTGFLWFTGDFGPECNLNQSVVFKLAGFYYKLDGKEVY